MRPAEEPHITVVYDDACRFCTLAKNTAHSLNQTGSIEFVGLSSERGKQLVQGHALDMQVSAYTLDDKVLAKSEMLERVLQEMGVLGRITRSALAFFPRSFKDRVYDFFAQHRRHARHLH